MNSGICEGCKMPALLSDGVLCGRCDSEAPRDCCEHDSHESYCKCCTNECDTCSDIDDDDYLMENS